jgi:hypothetical protein
MSSKVSRKKISASLPRDLLLEACSCTAANQTEAIIAGLKELIAVSKRKKALSMRGKIKINLSLDKIRERLPL